MDERSTLRGLTKAQVKESRDQFGSNIIQRKKRKSFLQKFFESFGDPIIKILLIALAINTLFLLKNFNWYETGGIAIAILLATFISTASEYGSESAFEKLQEDSAKIQCKILRAEGLTELPVGEVVTGDLLELQSGDKVPADGILICGSLDTDQSALNGETKEAHKTAGNQALLKNMKTADFSHPNFLFSGSVICSGEGIMKVTSVGDSTFYGSLAGEIQEETRESPLKIRLENLAKTISTFGYVGAALVAVAYLFNALVLDNGFDSARILAELSDWPVLIGQIMNAVTLAVTVIVVAVPEGLPMMITVVLSSNMKRMLKDHVLVRKLTGIETSGNINILFTDKTGTLTKGQLQVKTFISGNNQLYSSALDLKSVPPLWKLLHTAVKYNSSASMTLSGKKTKAIGGNATDRALLEFVSKHPGDPRKIRKTKTIPFDSARKYSASRISGDLNLTLIKGAPEKILPYCTKYYDEYGVPQPLYGIAGLSASMKEQSGNAVRLLAVATSSSEITEENLDFNNLTLIGVIGIRDEIRREAAGGVRQVTRAGIQVVMITGDGKDTAAAIAREIGLIRSNQEKAVLTSDELKRLSDEALKKRLPEIRVIARALPTDKSRLIRVSQELGLVAGMTGDGVNDAPALKKADVGFAMGSGTEVAKEAGDIVILDDNFLSISKAILYGRTTFKSIRKFIIFQLTVNLCAVGVSIVGPFIGIDAPVTVIQMLWINMVMDTLAGLAFGGEPPLPEYMDEPPKKNHEKIINKYMWNELIFTGFYTAALCIFFLKSPWISGLFREAPDTRYLMTGFFAFFMFAGIFNSFSARTHRLNLFSHILKNPAFMAVMLLVFSIQVGLIYLGGGLFRTAGLNFDELKYVLLLALSVIPVDLVRKIILRLKGYRRGC